MSSTAPLDIVVEGAVARVTLNSALIEALTSPLGLRLTKDVLNLSIDAASLEAVFALEDRNQVLCGRTDDFAEGVRAFLDKRKPRYNDR